jgi:hypothetical protein
VSQWFKGKELAFAFGVNLSISRLGSVINGIVEPRIAGSSQNDDPTAAPLIGLAFWVGFFVCLFSWCCGAMLCAIDLYADKKDGTSAKISEEDKFKWG